MKKGSLYLFPVVMGDTIPSEVIPKGTLERICSTQVFIVENARTARRFLKSCGTQYPLDSIIIHELDKHNGNQTEDHFFEELRKGIDTGLMSEAGMPGIADPGSKVVLAAHREGIKVSPCTGPSSIFLALSASGLNGQQFTFHGYLPKEKEERFKKIREIELQSKKTGYTQIFIETPYRNDGLIKDLIQSLSSDVKLCVAAGITTEEERIITFKISDWKKESLSFKDIPAVFLIN